MVGKCGFLQPFVKIESKIEKKIEFQTEEDGKATMVGTKWLADLKPKKTIKIDQLKVMDCCHRQRNPWRIQVLLDGNPTGLYLEPIHLLRYTRIVFEYKVFDDGNKVLSAGGLREVSSGRMAQLWGLKKLEKRESKFALKDIGEVLLENQETREDKASKHRTASHAKGCGSSSDISNDLHDAEDFSLIVPNGNEEPIVGDDKLREDYMSLAYHNPSIIGGRKVAKISASDVQKEIRRWKHAIVGYLVGEDTQDLNVESYLRVQWRDFGSFETYVHKRPGFFLFKFENGADKYRLLEQRQGFINNKPFILKRWKPDLSLDPSCFLATVPVWVRFPSLRLQFWSLESLAKISSLIGKPLFPDEPTANKESLEYARVCIEIELGDKLPEMVRICVDDDDDDNILEQAVEYEWKPCDYCCSFSHDASECALNSHSSGASVKEDGDISDLLSGDASVKNLWETDVSPRLLDEMPGLETGHDGNYITVDINCSAEEYSCSQECPKMQPNASSQLRMEAAIDMGTIQVLLESVEDYSQTACLLESEKNVAINWLSYYDKLKAAGLTIKKYFLG